MQPSLTPPCLTILDSRITQLLWHVPEGRGRLQMVSLQLPTLTLGALPAKSLNPIHGHIVSRLRTRHV